MKFVDPMMEKGVYVLISTWLRSPGCMFVTFLTREFLLNADTIFDKLFISICIILNFWNGQYYNMLTCIDYGKN